MLAFALSTAFMDAFDSIPPDTEQALDLLLLFLLLGYIIVCISTLTGHDFFFFYFVPFQSSIQSFLRVADGSESND